MRKITAFTIVFLLIAFQAYGLSIVTGIPSGYDADFVFIITNDQKNESSGVTTGENPGSGYVHLINSGATWTTDLPDYDTEPGAYIIHNETKDTWAISVSITDTDITMNAGIGYSGDTYTIYDSRVNMYGYYVYPTFNADVDWGDGSSHTTWTNYTGTSHTYASIGTFEIRIKGYLPTIRFYASGSDTRDLLAIRSIKNLGDVGWKTFESSFYNCTNITSVALKNGNLSEVVSLKNMLKNVTLPTSLNYIDEFNLANVETLGGWLEAMIGLTTTPAVRNYNIFNVKDLGATFMSLISTPESPDVSIWYTCNVNSYWETFRNCPWTTPSDTRNWCMDSAWGLNETWADCANLTIAPYVENFDFKNLSFPEHAYTSPAFTNSGTATSYSAYKLIDNGGTPNYLTNIRADQWVHNTTTGDWTWIETVDTDSVITLGEDIIDINDSYTIRNYYNRNHGGTFYRTFAGLLSSLTSPAVGLWNVAKAMYQSFYETFYNMLLVTNPPDVSTWTFHRKMWCMYRMFKNMTSLLYPPNIAGADPYWNTQWVYDMREMFGYMQSLIVHIRIDALEVNHVIQNSGWLQGVSPAAIDTSVIDPFLVKMYGDSYYAGGTGIKVVATGKSTAVVADHLRNFNGLFVTPPTTVAINDKVLNITTGAIALVTAIQNVPANPYYDMDLTLDSNIFSAVDQEYIIFRGTLDWNFGPDTSDCFTDAASVDSGTDDAGNDGYITQAGKTFTSTVQQHDCAHIDTGATDYWAIITGVTDTILTLLPTDTVVDVGYTYTIEENTDPECALNAMKIPALDNLTFSVGATPQDLAACGPSTTTTTLAPTTTTTTLAPTTTTLAPTTTTTTLAPTTTTTLSPTTTTTIPISTWADFGWHHSWLADDESGAGDGGNITDWTDGKSAGGDLSVYGNAPSYEADACPNTQPAIKFDKANAERVRNTTLTCSDPCTIVLIYRWVTSSHADTMWADVGGDYRVELYNDTGTQRYSAGTAIADGTIDTSFHTLRWFLDGTIGGTTPFQLDAGTEANQDAGETDIGGGIYLASNRFGNGNYADIEVCAAGLYEGDATDDGNWAALQAYVCSKWGLPLGAACP